jgi:hypothetical protein
LFHSGYTGAASVRQLCGGRGASTVAGLAKGGHQLDSIKLNLDDPDTFTAAAAKLNGVPWPARHPREQRWHFRLCRRRAQQSVDQCADFHPIHYP